MRTILIQLVNLLSKDKQQKITIGQLKELSSPKNTILTIQPLVSFILLLRLLHFTDNSASHVHTDPLHKIRIIVDHLKSCFKQYLCPFQNICIDESLLLFKGRIFFRQYIPFKRHRFGIKFFLLCDCETGYVLDFIIYTGAATQIQEHFGDTSLGKSGNIVLTLMNPYLNRGHCLHVDNWYTSPAIIFNFAQK